jgi:beta-galactosidase
MQRINNDWEYTLRWSEDFMRFETPAEAVRLPHNVGELPLHCASPENYEGLVGYRKRLLIPEEAAGQRVFLQFDAAAHIATVYCNRQAVAQHSCGYTAFRAEITSLVTPGEACEIAVKLDTSENEGIPPFGFVIDYLTYGGLYRDAWLDIRPKDYIEDLFIYTPEPDKAHVELTLDGTAAGAYIRLSDADGLTAYQLSGPGTVFDLTLQDAHPWSVDDPYLYTCQVSLLDEDGNLGDTKEVTFGFRTAIFNQDGFYLNGEKVFLRGLNRHQSFPYIGYAAPEHLQREDARILKEELGCTAVRTSHYPQSQYFIDECDRIGLLVFTEIPGWQHIGDEGWKDQAIENTREMVLQYRNHPSIILWGVRINESQDDDDLYRRTNKAAHALDPSRQTSGVRFIENSHLLEDVYAYNDFSHNGKTPPVKDKKAVTKEIEKGFFISEMNGHMFPTKPYDPWEKRQEHALRHARVQGAAFTSGEHAGCFGWCMFDYATHAEFGSGDRICYHGVMDSFRNPKLAAAVYASQGEEPVLEVSSCMDIGDYPGGQIGSFYLFTNADEVDIYRNDAFVATVTPKELFGLPHEPILVDDTVGQLLESEEGFSGGKAKNVRKALNAMAKYGANAIPFKEKMRLGWCMLRYRLSFAEGVRLYGKYVGGWGGAMSKWRFEGKKDGVVVSRVEKGPSSQLHISARPSKRVLSEGDAYDMAAVRIQIRDLLGNPAVYAQLPIEASAEGPIEIAGPSLMTAEGGSTGLYVRTTGEKGEGTLTLSAPGLAPVQISFLVK